MQKIEYLDPEIANEGSHAEDMSDLEPPHVYDYAAFKTDKHYKRYFKPYVFQPFPAWIYHATEEAKMVGDAKTAASYGVSYIKGDDHNEARWECSGEWKVRPVVKPKAKATDGGKTLVTASSQQQQVSTNELMAKILAQITAGNMPLPNVAKADPEFAEFLEYKKWKASQAERSEQPKAAAEPAKAPALELSEAEQKEILVGLAKEKEIHVDKRWSLDRIKETLDKVA
jgi:hypothetical protein